MNYCTDEFVSGDYYRNAVSSFYDLNETNKCTNNFYKHHIF